jgi:hypothetical protein
MTIEEQIATTLAIVAKPPAYIARTHVHVCHEVASVILFGSAAHGRTDPESEYRTERALYITAYPEMSKVVFTRSDALGSHTMIAPDEVAARVASNENWLSGKTE